ncbi:hypothetical protein L3X38_036970 [Prunus dulcis]|uniref:Uncharacterized protein n=1 Tax=Prunus dulcis TaxID=3755 RepID=A0AAD4V3M3_PRUDU|nr:hypothetical protein L3X38_036970 [Prunus dulcis]
MKEVTTVSEEGKTVEAKIKASVAVGATIEDGEAIGTDDPTVVTEVTRVGTTVAALEAAVVAMPSPVDLLLVLLSLAAATTVVPTPVTPHRPRGFRICSISTSSVQLLSLFPRKTKLMNFLSPASKIFSASFSSKSVILGCSSHELDGDSSCCSTISTGSIDPRVHSPRTFDEFKGCLDIAMALGLLDSAKLDELHTRLAEVELMISRYAEAATKMTMGCKLNEELAIIKE